ncbi:ABC transporter substrate-binding protein [Tessaracoccus defluvii]|uniref:Sugar ABC transporter substrate-binding protein n=1 Tax=Tessaracoccus defluvii TaxID=1285901 RepID=A0A7H0H9W6_9ACTN|nr:sugar ABC transporter substrate-binding protein [Tessaracoccus defluvii]QNP57332.1 sugar ABC transporter substrate-binding protein [Tessaracoccus defluvii]
MVPGFAKESGIDVEVQTSDWGSAFQKVTTGAASNSLADVLVIGGIWAAPLADKNVLLDLTDRISAWDERGQIYEKMLDDGAYEGKNYAVPIAADVRTGIYRQDLLEKVGVGSLPQTWDDFRAAAEELKGAEGIVAPIDFGIDKSIGLQQAFAQLFLQAGGQYWTDGKASFNSDAGNRALSFFVDLYQAGLADPNMVFSGNGPRPIIAGQAAMSLGGVQILGNAESNNKELAEKLVVGPGLKSEASSEARSVAWINKLAIAKGTKRADDAWELVRYLAAAPQLSEVSRLYDALPPRRDLADADWMDERRKGILATADSAVSQPPNPKMMALGPEVNSLLEPAIRGSVSVAETLKAIDAKVDSL